MGLLSRVWLHVRVRVSLGMATIPLRQLGVRLWIRLDVATGSMEQLGDRTPLHTVNYGKGYRTHSSTGRNGKNRSRWPSRSPSGLDRVSCRAEVRHGRIRNSTRLRPQPGTPESSSREKGIGRSSTSASVLGYFPSPVGRPREFCSSGGRTRSLFGKESSGKEFRLWGISRP